MHSTPPRVFYFDIDGTLTDYNDAPKGALANGVLERTLKERSFDQLVCVSGWSGSPQIGPGNVWPSPIPEVGRCDIRDRPLS